VDVVEVFVEIDSVGCVPGGSGERKHEVRDCTCPGVQNPKSAGVEAELCNKEGVMWEGGDSDGVGDESGNDVVGSQCKGAIPVGPIGRGFVRVIVIENVATQERWGIWEVAWYCPKKQQTTPPCPRTYGPFQVHTIEIKSRHHGPVGEVCQFGEVHPIDNGNDKDGAWARDDHPIGCYRKLVQLSMSQLDLHGFISLPGFLRPNAVNKLVSCIFDLERRGVEYYPSDSHNVFLEEEEEGGDDDGPPASFSFSLLSSLSSSPLSSANNHPRLRSSKLILNALDLAPQVTGLVRTVRVSASLRISSALSLG
jgi:hypothetical protein